MCIPSFKHEWGLNASLTPASPGRQRHRRDAERLRPEDHFIMIRRTLGRSRHAPCDDDCWRNA